VEFGEMSMDTTVEKQYWQEVFRIMNAARIYSGDELLDKCLNGRPQTTQSVSQLFKLARLHFEPDARGGGLRDKICEACLSYLEDNLSPADLEKLKNPEPAKYRSVLEEMGDN
jgi:hypothetical protein